MATKNNTHRISYDASTSERITAGGLGAVMLLGGLGMVAQGVAGVIGGLVAKDGGLFVGGTMSSLIGGSSVSMGTEAIGWAADPYMDLQVIDVMQDDE